VDTEQLPSLLDKYEFTVRYCTAGFSAFDLFEKNTETVVDARGKKVFLFWDILCTFYIKVCKKD
jgi:hypothetical protein